MRKLRISVVSGKGGAGKTSIAVSLALCRQGAFIVDCDVEEPNVSLFVPVQIEEKKVATKPVPQVKQDLCTFCRRCAEACQFNALMVLPNTVLVFEKLCHSCGTCSFVCPERAIVEVERPIGEIEKGKGAGIHYIGGRLFVGEAMATPLISQVRGQIPSDAEFVVIDAPPGITCPVVEAVDGADFVVLVAESTPFGLQDMRLVVEFLEEMKVPFGVVENKAGLCEEPMVQEFCRSSGIDFLASIPFDEEIASSYSEGIPMIHSYGGDVFEQIISFIEDRL